MVDDPGAGAPFRDDAGLLELVQMAREGGQGGRGQPAEVVDAVILAAQGVQDQDAGGVGEGFEDVGAGFGLGGVHICTFAQLCKCVKSIGGRSRALPG